MEKLTNLLTNEVQPFLARFHQRGYVASLWNGKTDKAAFEHCDASILEVLKSMDEAVGRHTLVVVKHVYDMVGEVLEVAKDTQSDVKGIKGDVRGMRGDLDCALKEKNIELCAVYVLKASTWTWTWTCEVKSDLRNEYSSVNMGLVYVWVWVFATVLTGIAAHLESPAVPNPRHRAHALSEREGNRPKQQKQEACLMKQT